MKPISKLLVVGAALSAPFLAVALASAAKPGPVYLVLSTTEEKGKYAFAPDKAPRADYVYFGVPRTLANYLREPSDGGVVSKTTADVAKKPIDGGPPPDLCYPPSMRDQFGRCIGPHTGKEKAEIVCVPATCNPPGPGIPDPLKLEPGKPWPDDARALELIIAIDRKHLFGELRGIR